MRIKEAANIDDIDFDIERICMNCEHSTFLDGTENCVCKKKGIVRTAYSCRRFKADLLKIKPRRACSFVFDENPLVKNT